MLEGRGKMLDVRGKREEVIKEVAPTSSRRMGLCVFPEYKKNTN
jgi:hypothetical protein